MSNRIINLVAFAALAILWTGFGGALVLNQRILDQLGPAVNSGQSLFVYGPPGNGKTAIAQSIGGAAANLAEHCIKKVEVLEYPELGMEAIWRIEVEDFPAFIIIDDKGNDFFKELNLG